MKQYGRKYSNIMILVRTFQIFFESECMSLRAAGPAKGTTKNSPAKENVEPTKTSPSIQQKLSDILPQKRQLRSSKLSHNPIDRVALQAVGLAH